MLDNISQVKSKNAGPAYFAMLIMACSRLALWSLFQLQCFSWYEDGGPRTPDEMCNAKFTLNTIEYMDRLKSAVGFKR